MIRCGVDMFDVEHLFITHTHSDHFQFEEIVSKSHAVKTNGKPLHIYMSVPAKEYLERILFTFDAQIEDEPDPGNVPGAVPRAWAAVLPLL